MIGLKRRRKVEGWTVNVPDGYEAGNNSLRQKLADNNKLWIFSLVAIVLITGFLIHKTNQHAAPVGNPSYVDKYKVSSDAACYDEAHQKFTEDIKKNKSFNFTPINVSFVGSGLLQVVVPGDVSADDVEYMASITGMKALHSLKERIVVNVYYNKASDGEPDATASYNPKRNGYAVKFKESGVKTGY